MSSIGSLPVPTTPALHAARNGKYWMREAALVAEIATLSALIEEALAGAPVSTAKTELTVEFPSTATRAGVSATWKRYREAGWFIHEKTTHSAVIVIPAA